jgi:hypothetical protein
MTLADSEALNTVYSFLCAARDKGGEIIHLEVSKPHAPDPKDPERFVQVGDTTLTLRLRIPK